MMQAVTMGEYSDMQTQLQSLFHLQQKAYQADINPSLQQRRADLFGLRQLLIENEAALIAAIQADFGCRSEFETRFAEIFLAREAALSAAKALKKWLKPQNRSLDPLQYPFASAWTFPQPVGVVGIVVPWNFPVAMAFQPLIGAFAAGNRAMVKMSANSRNLALLLRQITPRYFNQDKLCFLADDPADNQELIPSPHTKHTQQTQAGLGPAFTSLPWNHLFFTGSVATGRAVMTNAAKNLTPVTLELGGKSPAVVAADYPLKQAAERILWAKMLNAGQICTNVDYLFLQSQQIDDFISAARHWCKQHYPDLNNGDYSAIIDDRSWLRLTNAVKDALNKGATLVPLYSGPQPDHSRRIMAPVMLLNVTDEMDIMQQEIFGPVLPVLVYQTEQDVLDYVNQRPRPLAFYIFSNNKKLQQFYLNHSISGGVGINEAVVQAALHNLPFGGSGDSGMGHYHGYEGFLTFSKLRPVFKQGLIRGLDFLQPPYRLWPTRLLNLLFSLKA